MPMPKKKARLPRRSTAAVAQAEEKKPFDQRLFSGAKIKRVLERQYQIDMKQFVRDYDDDTSRSHRIKPLEDEEVAAIQRFIKHKNTTQLANDLSCSITSAQARVTRYVLDHVADA